MVNSLPPASQLFGRIEYFDPRSRNYQIRAEIDRAKVYSPRSYTWRCLAHIIQQEGSCVGHGIIHDIAARPVELPVSRDLALRVYRDAQLIDFWPDTPPKEGTAVVSGMQAAVALGYYADAGGYRWAGAGSGKLLEDVLLSLGYFGPGIAGTKWTTGMMWPDANGFIAPTGGDEGGHAYLVNGIKVIWRDRLAAKETANVSLGSPVRIKNSWPWGNENGEAFMTLESLMMLLEDRGEFCIPVIRTRPAA